MQRGTALNRHTAGRQTCAYVDYTNICILKTVDTIGELVETVASLGNLTTTGTYYTVHCGLLLYSLRRLWMIYQGRAETTDNWCGVYRQTLGDP